ncbi:acetyl-CoA acetyltransferase [Sphingosinicella microcystinivorans]|uniref:acetyl-CoA acetyltransferase n=1 Tax=Sphingosinicella microcystinivorans TaxID=335406 RepID=UPI0022F3E158|nr:acetyl-CoA acetyltransferase [Sphingosinicella microcystinivorans]WBX84423.1 acetyl-CoA acetyltransferase [Sphingosinicella microcystinivorans]
MSRNGAYAVPVIVGVGQINDAREDSASGFDTLELMALALERADHDAGGGLLARADFLGIENQVSSEITAWPAEAPITPHLLRRIGVAPRSTLLTREPSGDGPVFLLNHAANLIATGEAEVAAIVGAEALRTAAYRNAARKDDGAGKSNVMRDLLDRSVRPFLKKYGLMTPADVYPLYETGTRAAWGQSFADAQRETGILWSHYSRAAAANEGAWIREALEPDAITTASPRNRVVTYPYTKLMVANSAVNQGAAVILTSLGKARELGIAEDRIVFVGAGAAAHEDEDFLARDSYAGSAAMTVSIRRAMELNGLAAGDLDFVELYNCFPCVAKMARRVLGWPLDRSPSVYGGLSFGGGPIGNCMMHAAVVMTQKLRAGGRSGLIFANGGFATHNHSIVLTRRMQDGLFPQDFDCQSEADRLRGAIPPLDEAYAGPGRIEAYTVPYGRDGLPGHGTVVGLSPQGVRFVCRVPRSDEETLRFLVSGETEPVGTTGTAVPGEDGYVFWRRGGAF